MCSNLTPGSFLADGVKMNFQFPLHGRELLLTYKAPLSYIDFQASNCAAGIQLATVHCNFVLSGGINSYALVKEVSDCMHE